MINLATEAVYDATLTSVKESFPQYIRELEGVAHGAGVEFHKVKSQKKIKPKLLHYIFFPPSFHSFHVIISMSLVILAAYG